MEKIKMVGEVNVVSDLANGEGAKKFIFAY